MYIVITKYKSISKVLYSCTCRCSVFIVNYFYNMYNHYQCFWQKTYTYMFNVLGVMFITILIVQFMY